MLVFLCSTLACIDAPRDNIYDPKNPDRACIRGTVYEPDGLPVPNTTVSLISENGDVRSTISDDSGVYRISDIIPDIYRIKVEAPYYYDTLSFYPESLWAETDSTGFDFYLTTLTFEDDDIGTQNPHAFTATSGIWTVVRDTGSSIFHSIPNVYKGIDTHSTGFASTLFRSIIYDFSCNVNFKVESSSVQSWQAGIIFRYQNQYNHYLVAVSRDSLGFYVIKDSTVKISHCIPGIFECGQWYSIGVVCHLNLITVFLNDTARLFINDNIFNKGYCGLYASNRNITGESTQILFDDVYIKLN